MFNTKILSCFILLIMVFTIFIPSQVASAASVDNVLSALTTPTVSAQSASDSGVGILEKLFNLLFEKILGPILNIVGGNSSSTSGNTRSTPKSPSTTDPLRDSGVLRGKTIVVDPGHGGSNPGAVENNTRESDNNLAVGLKLKDRLAQAGAKVIMTRSTDRTVASEGSSLGEELQARVNLAEANHADLFVSIHSNSNPDDNIAGAMTFYPRDKSSKLALEVQNALIQETKAIDKGTSPATFYVLRNTSMPSILVEMGFVSNQQEAIRLQSDAYRSKIALGIFNGIVEYFNNY